MASDGEQVSGMNQKENISALLDGELGESDLSRLLNELTDDDLDTWHSFSAVGDLMRSTDLATLHRIQLLDQIDAALQHEPTVVAPVLKATLAQRLSAKLASSASTRRFAASVAAVGFFSFALYQAIPPVDKQVQMVRVQSAQSVSDEELALWQEYFMAHQQNSIRGGLAGVSPIARVEADRPLMSATERVGMGVDEPAEWMNVWEPASPQMNGQVQFNYVSATR